MSSKKWLAMFFVTVLLILAGLGVLNILADPFGVFGLDVLEWPSYEMTMNPRTAKISYLKDHHGQYDSYVVGASSSSSFPVEKLNEYTGASFYNMFAYGSDMYDVEQEVRYLVEHYTVKRLVVNVYVNSACKYDAGGDRTSILPPEVTGESPWTFYPRFIAMDPRFSVDKLTAMRSDTYLTQAFDVFNERTGAYDKTVRDAEPIGSMEEYLQNYPVFADYPTEPIAVSEEAISGTLRSLAAIRDLCGENGVELMVVTAPLYWQDAARYDWEEMSDFYIRMAQVVPYWNFTLSSVSFDPRYFYDEAHFRNCVGDMALARIFDDDSVYIPEDFGFYVTAENAADYWAGLKDLAAPEAASYTAQVPVLLYHCIGEEGNGSTCISLDLFEAHMELLHEAGYTAVLPEDLREYVLHGTELPEKPVVITFDDGYRDNYLYAYPILQKYGLKGTIFVIGVSVGALEYYKDTQYLLTPHFTYEEAAEMVDSGVMAIASHTYDMHQWPPFETGRVRENILRWEDEGEAAYREALAGDCEIIRREIMDGTGQDSVNAMAFPGGEYDTLAQVTLLENGFDVTFSTRPGVNTVMKGMPQTLLSMHRLNMVDSVSPEILLNMLTAEE